MKKILKGVGSIIICLAIIVLCLYIDKTYTETNYNRCINQGVSEHICKEILD